MLNTKKRIKKTSSCSFNTHLKEKLTFEELSAVIAGSETLFFCTISMCLTLLTLRNTTLCRSDFPHEDCVSGIESFY